MTEQAQLAAHKEIVRQFLDCLGRADAPALASLMTDDATVTATGTSIISRTRTKAEFVDSVANFNRLMKDGVWFEILHLTADEDRVSAEIQGHSVLTSGEQYDNQYHFLFFLRDGKVAKLREYLCTKLAEDIIGPAKARAAAAAAG